MLLRRAKETRFLSKQEYLWCNMDHMLITRSEIGGKEDNRPVNTFSPGNPPLAAAR